MGGCVSIHPVLLSTASARTWTRQRINTRYKVSEMASEVQHHTGNPFLPLQLAAYLPTLRSASPGHLVEWVGSTYAVDKLVVMPRQPAFEKMST